MSDFAKFKADQWANAIVAIAKKDAPLDWFLGKVFWGLSVWCVTGSFQREKIPKWTRRSDAARDALNTISNDASSEVKLRFEHPRPIKEMYRIAREERETLTKERLYEIIGEYPPIVITVEEDNAIPKEFKASGNPEDRYKGIALSTCTLRSWPSPYANR